MNFVLSLQQIQSQLNKALDDMSASLCTLKEGMSYTKQLPSKGLSQSQVLDKIREYETLSKSSFIPELQGSLSVKMTVWKTISGPHYFWENWWPFPSYFFGKNRDFCHYRWGEVGERMCVRCSLLGRWKTDQAPGEGMHLCTHLWTLAFQAPIVKVEC